MANIDYSEIETKTIYRIVSKCKRLAEKEYKPGHLRVGKVICKEIDIWPYEQMVFAQTRICPTAWGTKFSGILRLKQII